MFDRSMSFHFVVVPVAAISLVACASSGSYTDGEYVAAAPATIPALSPTSRIFDGARLVRMGAHTAWDAVRFLAPHYRLRDHSRAGAQFDRLTGQFTPRVVVDGHQLADHELLRSIPAHEIVAVQILSAIEAGTLFGPADEPVIVVQTLASFRRR
jgi:hypothetical protein